APETGPRICLPRLGRRRAARGNRRRCHSTDRANPRRTPGAVAGQMGWLARGDVHYRSRSDFAHGMPAPGHSPARAAVHYSMARRLHCPGNGEKLDSMTPEPLAIARDLILRPSGLDDTRLDAALSQVMSSSVDAADLYFQLSREESWALEDGIVKEGSASIEQGVGVRALAGEKTGFDYRDEIVLPALEEASRAAGAIAHRGQDRPLKSVLPSSGHSLYLPIDPVSSFTSSEKVAWLERVDRETRKMDPR